ncbi:hypothetical protein [uncultured Brevundimonas sp.]|uniref:tetratricopeptide repeat protein n=1 Tax=uncultured Brevundimonas sp. TaxID=213418 RepID=UPI0030EB5810|tara:strand:- start:1848 stop:2996 length:1149 start_codon:yes stop_codon:yes gene_type:complete
MAVGRLPAEQSLRLSPDSAVVLGRAAESEFADDRFDNAEYLAQQSLVRAPFNVQALRVLGLAAAEGGRKEQADDVLTLAGNWSLRDDPAHAWLMDYRLTRGDYRSSFAHADTLARRREDLRPQLFRLFTVAASTDGRALPVLASLLEAAPPWRSSYISSLYQTESGLSVAANLAVSLQPTESPFSNAELTELYFQLLAKNRLQAMTAVRTHLGRPDVSMTLVNGEFDVIHQPVPYEWRLFTAGGSVAEILPDEIRGDSALRAQFGSYSSARLAEQLIQLKAGSYRFSGQTWAEVGDPGARLTWTVYCFETGAKIGESRIVTVPGEQRWKPFSFSFEVPTRGCSAQWIRLIPNPGDRRTTVVGWYDRFAIVRLGRRLMTEANE